MPSLVSSLQRVGKYVDAEVGLALPIQGADPYFLWALENQGRRLGRIRPSPKVKSWLQGLRAAAGPFLSTFPTLKRKKTRPLAQYFQVVIEIWDQTTTPEQQDKRKKDFWNFIKSSQAGVQIRGAYSEKDRFVTGIVPDRGMVEFLATAPQVCSRYEMAHPISSHDELQRDGARHAATFAHNHADCDHDHKRLSGKVMVIIDFGCPFAHQKFRVGNTSRVKYVWFQDSEALRNADELPRVRWREGNQSGTLFPYGRELCENKITKLIAANTTSANIVDEAACYEALGYDLMREAATHGGHVMDVACGDPNPLHQNDTDDWLTGTRCGAKSQAVEHDDASECEIIFIELPRAAVGDSSGGGMNAFLIDALRYVLHRTTEHADVVVNCSFGTNAGPHDGSSMLERAVHDTLQQRKFPKFNFVVPAGNSFSSACHAAGRVSASHPLKFTLDVPADKSTDTFIEIWYAGGAALTVEVTQPFAGGPLGRIAANTLATWATPSHRSVPLCTVVHVKDATPTSHMMLVVIAPPRPRDETLPEAAYGHWCLEVATTDESETVVDAWIERDDPIFDLPSDRQSRFVVHAPADAQDEYLSDTVTKFGTLNSYASAGNVFSAGAAIVPTKRFASVGAGGIEPQMSVYSSGGNDLMRTALGKPEFVAYADDSLVLPGRNAAGSTARSVVRLNGTSVASPQIARNILNTGGPFGTAIPFRPSVEGARGDGLSFGGEYLQLCRAGTGLLFP